MSENQDGDKITEESIWRTLREMEQKEREQRTGRGKGKEKEEGRRSSWGVLTGVGAAFVIGSAAGLLLTRRPSKHAVRDLAHVQARLQRTRQLREQHHRLFPSSPKLPPAETFEHVNLASPSEGLRVAVPAFVAATALVGSVAGAVALYLRVEHDVNSWEQLAQALQSRTPPVLSDRQRESVLLVEQQIQDEAESK